MDNPVAKAISIVGSQTKLAHKCGVRQQSVGKWLKKGKVPSARATRVEKIVKRQIKRHELCPDFPWK